MVIKKSRTQLPLWASSLKEYNLSSIKYNFSTKIIDIPLALYTDSITYNYLQKKSLKKTKSNKDKIKIYMRVINKKEFYSKKPKFYKGKNGNLYFKSFTHSGFINPDSLEGFFNLKSSKHSLSTFYFILRSFSSIFKLFVLHSSCIIYKNKAYLFFGKSGSGKSTIAKKFKRKFTMLDDEANYIAFKNNNFNVYLPFFHSGSKKDSQDLFYKIKAVYLLKHHKENLIKLISLNEKLNEIWYNNICEKLLGKKENERKMDLLLKFISSVDINELSFRKKCDFEKIVFK